MDFDYRKLRGKIKELYDTQAEFSVALGLKRTALSHRLNNLVDFSPAEIVRGCDLLSIPKTEIAEYFFTQRVQKHEQIMNSPIPAMPHHSITSAKEKAARRRQRGTKAIDHRFSSIYVTGWRICSLADESYR